MVCILTQHYKMKKSDLINDMNNNKLRVFLGGTCNSSTWRDILIDKLQIDYFNPVVKDWTPECQENEIREREQCDLILYVITPLMKGVYSIAEVVEDSIKRPNKTLFCILDKDDGYTFGKDERKSLKSVEDMVDRNGALVFNSLTKISDYLNKYGISN